MPPTLEQTTARPCLHQRLLDPDRNVWYCLLWGHCSFLLDPGAHKVLFVSFKCLCLSPVEVLISPRGGNHVVFSSCGGILELRRGSQPSPWVGPGKPNLPLGLRGKAGACARVTAGPKRPHLGVCPALSALTNCYIYTKWLLLIRSKKWNSYKSRLALVSF